MKKKLLIALGLSGIIATSVAVGAYAASDIKLFINGKLINADLQIVDGSSYVPLKVVSESLGAEVKWDGDKREISIVQKGETSPATSVQKESDDQIALEYVNTFLINDDAAARQTFLENKIHPDVKSLFSLSVNLKKSDMKVYSSPKVTKNVPYQTGNKNGSLTLIQTDQEKLIVLVVENKLGYVYSESATNADLKAAYDDLIKKF